MTRIVPSHWVNYYCYYYCYYYYCYCCCCCCCYCCYCRRRCWCCHYRHRSRSSLSSNHLPFHYFRTLSCCFEWPAKNCMHLMRMLAHDELIDDRELVFERMDDTIDTFLICTILFVMNILRLSMSMFIHMNVFSSFTPLTQLILFIFPKYCLYGLFHVFMIFHQRIFYILLLIYDLNKK